MNVIRRWVSLLLTVGATILALDSLAVPACPLPFEATQPDGTKIALRKCGDEFIKWYEDAEGFSVVQDATSKVWHYAEVSADGKRLVPSSMRVGDSSKGLPAVRHLLPPKKVEAVRARKSSLMQGTERGTHELWKTGTVTQLVILVEFSDVKFVHGQTAFNNLFNKVGYSADGNIGSIKDYYKEISYGKLDVQSTVVGPITLSNTYAYYGANDGDGDDYNVCTMLTDALKALDDTGFDFSPFDVDGDGWLDELEIIHAGWGEEYGDNSEDNIWSARWFKNSSTAYFAKYDGVKIHGFHTEPELRGSDTVAASSCKITQIGVICHEFGHSLGLPDLYDTDGSSYGVGRFCLMAGGSWGYYGSGDQGTCPVPMSAWCKKRLGWVVPTEITVNGTYSLSRAEDNDKVYMLKGNLPGQEYFLVENKTATGYGRALPGSERGLLIWHVDDAMTSNENESHYWVDLEEASGTQHLSGDTNSGNDSDYFRSATMSSFTSTTTPNNKSYSGTALGLNISGISGPGNPMTFTISGGSDPSTTTVKITKPTGANTVYSGSQETGVTYDSRLTLVSGTVAATSAGNYSATFSLPANTASTTYQWADGTTANQTVNWQIYACNVNASEVTFASIPNQNNTGSAITPAITMTFAGVKRTQGTDYTVSYANNINVGTATATVSGIGNFQGTKTLEFSIVESTTTSHVLTLPAAGGNGSVAFTIATAGQYLFAGANPAEWITSLSGTVVGNWTYSFQQANSSISVFANSTVTLNCSAAANTTGSTLTWDYVITGPENHTVTIKQPATNDPDPDPDPDPLTFTTGGDSNWYEQSECTYGGSGTAWRSGAISHSQTSWLKTEVTGEGVLSFYWLASSESGCDILNLYVDGNYVKQTSGVGNNWREVCVEITGAGTHTVKWQYSKDSSVSKGEDAGFVDQIEWREGEHLPNLSVKNLEARNGQSSTGTRLFNLDDEIVLAYEYGNSGAADVEESFTNYIQVVNLDTWDGCWTCFDGMEMASGASVSDEIALSEMGSCCFELTPGVYEGYLYLDDGDAIGEVSENDNYATTVFAVRDPETLKNALDNSSLTFKTSGTDAWYGTKGYGSDGIDCACSLQTGNSTTNDMWTTVAGPKILSFKWKVSSEEDYDWLQLLIDGKVTRQISGTSECWQECQVEIPSGNHTVTWRYAKDVSYSYGGDCGWVDQVELLDVDPTAPNCYGLFVGINNYMSGQPTLLGCVADAKAMKMVCSDYGDWPKYKMTVLTDYEATLSRFKQEIASLVAVAKSGDTVLIYDSGHGGPSMCADHTDEKDTCICTTDDYYEDVDFAADIAKFASGVKVIVMLDTCQSAGMFKGMSTTASSKSGTSTFLKNFIANVSAAIDKQAGLSKGTASSTISSSDIGWIAAANYDTYSQDAVGMGLFTGFMVVDSGILAGNADKNKDGSITFKEMFEHATALSSDYEFDQVAQAANTDVLSSVSLHNRRVSLDEALDNDDLTFEASGLGFYVYGETYTDEDTPSWIGQDLKDGCCARTAVLPYYSPAVMTTTVSGSGTLSFKWRVSSALSDDVLCVYVDGDYFGSISGDQNWADVSLAVDGEGDHVIEWVYSKSSCYYGGAKGDDCAWVDQVAWTGSVPESEFTYDLVGGKAVITGGKNLSGDIVIPAEIGGYEVSRIANAAFYYRRGITSVTIPAGVTNVGEQAFWGCSDLESVSLSATVNVIGWGAFFTCDSLNEINVSSANGTYSSVNGVVYDKWMDSLICCPAGISGVFEIPTGVMCIENYAFYECKKLTSVKIPNSVQQINWGSFFGCSALESLTIPSSVKWIDDFAFAWCSALKTITVDAENAYYASDAGVLYDKKMECLICCPGGKSGVFSVPVGVKYIGYQALIGCAGLTSVTLPAGVTDINLYAFERCTSLVSITIPSSVTTIGMDAFNECPSLDVIYVGVGDTARVRSLLEASGLDCTNISFVESSPNTVKVTFDPNGGTVEEPTRQVTSGSAVGPLPTATWADHSFLGWFTDREGGSQVKTDTVVTADVTFYAHWTKGVPTYGPWGESEDVGNPDQLAPTMLKNATLTIYDEPAARGDVVAVFRTDTDTLCGLGKVLNDNATLTIPYYAPKGVRLTFKVWQAASGSDLTAILDCDTKCDLIAGGDVTGHALVVSDTVELTLTIKRAGWQAVSFNVEPEDATPDAVFAEIADQVDSVVQGVSYWMPGEGGTLSKVKVGKAYWVKTLVDSVSWTVTGKVHPETEISLSVGWNLVGYTLENAVAVEEALKAALAAGVISDVVCGIDFFPDGSLTEMKPGKAYWVNATQAFKFVYGQSAKGMLKGNVPVAKSEKLSGDPIYGPWGDEDDEPANPDQLAPWMLKKMSVSVDGSPAAQGDVVAVFREDTGALCGFGRALGTDGKVTVPTYAPKGTTLSFKLWVAASGMVDPVVLTSADKVTVSGTEGTGLSLAFVTPPPSTTAVSFDANGGTGGPAAVTATKGKAMPAITAKPTKAGYAFAGYFDAADTKYYNADLTSAKNWDKDDETATLYAHWTANAYTVTFHSNYGTDKTTTQNFTYDVAQNLMAIADIGWTREGHPFLGWAETAGGEKRYDDNESVKNLSDEPNGNVDLYAKWDTQTFTVTIDGVESQYEYGQQITLTPPTSVVGIHGYTNLVCQGWTGGSGDIASTGKDDEVKFTVTQASTLSWLYQTNYFFMVSSDGHGSVDFKTDGLEEADVHWTARGGYWAARGKKMVLTATPNAHYSFIGWKNEATGSIDSTDNPATFTVNNPLVLSATFATETFTVTFDLGDYGMRTGGGELTQTVEYGQAAEAPEVMPNDGCVFVKWDKAFDSVEGNLTVKAVYDFTQYMITYKEVRGDNPTANPTTYAVTNETITFAALQKVPAGYHFQGWEPASITKGSTGNKTVTAQWTMDIVVDGDEPTGFAAGQSVTLRAKGENNDGLTNVVCIGWTGTGSIPASGKANTVTFTLDQPSSLTWLYQTNYWVNISDGCGSASLKLKAHQGEEDTPLALQTWVEAYDGVIAATKLDCTNEAGTVAYKYVGYDSNVPGREHVERTAADPNNELMFEVDGAKWLNWNYQTNFYFEATSGEHGKITVDQTDVKDLENVGDGYWTGFNNVTSVNVKATADANYHFVGWQDASGDIVSTDAEHRFVLNRAYVVTATFAFNTYKVKFDLDGKADRTGGGELEQEVGYEKAATEPKFREKPGYTFKKWSADFSKITADLTVKAEYDLEEYKITYNETKDCVNSNPVKFTVEDAKTFTSLTNPPGWKFLSWEPAGFAKGTTSNLTVTAQWERLKYKVNIGGVAGEYYYGDKVTNRTDAAETAGYTNLVCLGWIGTGDVPKTGETNEVVITVTQDSTLQWQYATNFWMSVKGGEGGVFTLKDVTGADVAAEGWVRSGTGLLAEATADEGWKFAGWKDAETGAVCGEAAKLTIAVTKPVLLNAVFEPLHYTVKFDLGAFGTLKSGKLEQDVAWGQAAVAPEFDVAIGHEFVGWDCEFDKVTKDLAVKALYDDAEFPLTYEGTMGCDNSKNPTFYTIEDAVEFAALTNPPGWKFLGWEPASIEKGTAGGKTVTAKWEHIVYAVDVAGVKGDHYYGDVVTVASPLENVSGDTNLVCLGWTGTGDIPATGVGTQVTFAVTQPSALTWLYQTNYWFEAGVVGSGEVVVGEAGYAADVAGCWVPAGTNVFVTAVPAEHWHFAGWTGAETGVAVTSEAALEFVMHGPVLLDAEFALDTFEVTFDLGEYGTRTGGGELTQSVGYGQAAVAPTFDVTAGYTFTGWDEKFDSVTHAQVVLARYEETEYTITYEDVFDCDNAANPKKYTVTDALTFVALADRPGWSFVGWSPAGIDAGTTGNLTVKALWNDVKTVIEPDEVVESPTVEKNAENYVGYLYDADDGALAGTVQVTAGKGKTDKKTKAYTSKISVSIQLADGSKKISISGTYDLTKQEAQTFTNEKAKPARSVTLLLGANGMTGSFEGYVIGGVPKATSTVSYEGSYNVFADEGQFVITINKKGTAKVAGTTVAGKSVSASVSLVMGERNACVPVLVTKYGLAFTLWLEGDDVSVEGLTNAEVGEAGTLVEGATFQVDADGLAKLIGDATYADYFPCGLSVKQDAKNKWIVADGAKTGTVTLNKDGTVNEAKLGVNPSALKLTFTSKNGTFTGSFKVYYQVVNKKTVKAKSYTFKVRGILVDGVGYGTASAKIGKETKAIGILVK